MPLSFAYLHKRDLDILYPCAILSHGTPVLRICRISSHPAHCGSLINALLMCLSFLRSCKSRYPSPMCAARRSYSDKTWRSPLCLSIDSPCTALPGQHRRQGTRLSLQLLLCRPEDKHTPSALSRVNLCFQPGQRLAKALNKYVNVYILTHRFSSFGGILSIWIPA